MMVLLSKLFSVSARSFVIASRRFEHFDRIAGRILEQHLPHGNTPGRVVAKVDPATTQRIDGGVQIRDLNQNPIPASGCRHSTVGQGVPAWVCARYAQQQTQVAVVQHGEHWARTQLFLEAQVSAIEVDGGLQVLDEVADRGYGLTLGLVDRLQSPQQGFGELGSRLHGHNWKAKYLERIS